MKLRRLAIASVLAAAALTIFVIESYIPPIVPIPGIKPGLANIITLTAMVLLSRREAGAVLAVRIILGSVFAGSMSSLLFSAAGGILAYAVMCLSVGAFPSKRLWAVSILAAIAHNVGQLAVAAAVSGTPGILIYAPALFAAAIVTGAFTGLAAMYIIPRLPQVK